MLIFNYTKMNKINLILFAWAIISLFLMSDAKAADYEVCANASKSTISELVFHENYKILRDIFIKGLALDFERRDPFYQTYGFHHYYDGIERISYTSIGTKELSLWAKNYFTDEANENNIYVHFMGERIVGSYYCSDAKPLSYGVDFYVSLVPLNDGETKVSVKTGHARISVGKSFNVHAMGFVPNSVDVPPSAPDEYKLLRYLAYLAGIELKPEE